MKMKTITIPVYIYERLKDKIDDEIRLFNANEKKLSLIENGCEFGTPSYWEADSFYPHKFIKVLDKENFIIETEEIATGIKRAVCIPAIIVFDKENNEYVY